MNLTSRMLTAGALLVALAGCATSADDASPSPTTAPQMVMPVDTAVVAVTVTRPTDPTPVDPSSLPPTARGVSQMTSLGADEKACAESAIAATLDRDPTIAEANGKVAGVMGGAVVACTTPERVGDILVETLGPEGGALAEPAAGCVRSVVLANPSVAANFLASVFTTDPAVVMSAAQPFADRCSVDLDS